MTPQAVSLEASSARRLTFNSTLALLVLVPLAFTTTVFTRYALPKFVALLVGSSFLVLLLAISRRESSSSAPANASLFRSKLCWFVYLYLAAIAASTAFGVAPISSLFGSSFNYMGFLTRLCFIIVFITLVRCVGASETRLRVTLMVIAGTGSLVALYAVAQSFGIEPFVEQSSYTFPSRSGPLVRVNSTLGHADYLGHFLLYTTLTTAGLAFAGRGRLRLLAALASGLSIAAIVFSGTRGSWVGILAGAIVFAGLELRSAPASGLLRSRRLIFGSAGVVVLGLLIALSPASHTVIERGRQLVTEGLSSSGRLILWRDSIKMAPSFPIVGCGPEGFRKAFLGFKSKELAQLSPNTNNENPHNAYLGAAISFGLVGCGLYVAMIASALVLLVRARRRVNDKAWRLIITGLIASFSAVLVNNIFIFDQIANGLYFFVFLALAQVTANFADARQAQATGEASSRGSKRGGERVASSRRRARAGWPIVASGVGVVISIWYCAGLLSSDAAYEALLNPAKPVEYDQLVKIGDRVTGSPLPTGAYDYLFARAVDRLIRQTAASERSQDAAVAEVRTQALRLATEHVEKSLDQTLTPDLNYSLLSSLALGAGDVDKARNAASEAVRWDPNSYRTRSLLADAYLAGGDREQAVREAQIALDLNPFSKEAASTLARTRDPADALAVKTIKARMRAATPYPKRSVQALIEVARALAEEGLLEKAGKKLATAIRRADGSCADCHRELALVYEKLGRNEEAIAQWEFFIEQAPERASAERIKERVASLKQ